MQQIEMDFARGDQLGLLRDVRFADCGGASGMVVKAVLRAIDDSGRECFKSQETLAAEANAAARTVRRAISVLVAMSLITRTLKRNRYGVVTNHYRIVWNEIEMLVAHQKAAPVCIQPPQCAGSPELTDRPSVQTDRPCRQTDRPFGPDRKAMMASNPKGNAKNRHQPAREREAAADLDLSRQLAVGSWQQENTLTTDDCQLTTVFRAIGIKRATLMARRFAGRASDVIRAVEVYSSQRSRFASPGAVIDFLETGEWPVDGVLSVDELAARSEKRTTVSAGRDRERVRCEIAQQWKRAGRWESATEAEIEAEVCRRIGPIGRISPISPIRKAVS